MKTLGLFFFIGWLGLFSFNAQAEKILMIGDSLSCGSFGARMVKNLSSANDVTLYCAVSSAPTNWLNGKSPRGQKCMTMTSASKKLIPCGGTGATPTLSSILAKHRGERMIVALGTNSMYSAKADHSYRVMAEEIQAASSQCQWIGPPRLHPSQAVLGNTKTVATFDSHNESFYSSLDGSIGSLCPVVDSRPFTHEGTPGYATVDGIHRNQAAGKFWADHLMTKLRGEARSPKADPNVGFDTTQ